MRGYYLTPNAVSSVGIFEKIKNQVSIFNNNELETLLLFDENEKSGFSKIKKRLPFYSKQLRVLDDEKLVDADFLYIRRPFTIDRHFIKTLMTLKNKNNKLKIILEYPTYPYDFETKRTVSNSILISKNNYWRKKLYLCVDRIATYSDDQEIHGVKTIRISNGADFKAISRKKSKFNNQDVHMIAVASLSYWHGYDRMIKGLGNYYKNGGKRKIYFHIVGDGDSETIESYQKLIDGENLKSYVFLYGRRMGDSLSELFDKSDIAVDSLGRHRSRVYYNSSLKGKEYLARGLPIVSGVKTELDIDSSYKYYFRVPSDDSACEIDDIINFYDKIKSELNLSEKIYNYAYTRFDLSNVMLPVINFIKGEEKR